MASFQIQAIDFRGATGSTLVVFDDEHVLWALHSSSSEGDVHLDIPIGVTHGGSHSDAVDHPVGQVEKCQLNVVDQIGKIIFIKCDGNGGESFIESRLECQRKSFFFPKWITCHWIQTSVLELDTSEKE